MNFKKMNPAKMAAGVLAALSILAMPISASASVQSYGGADKGANTVPVTVNYSGTSARAMIPKSISSVDKNFEYTVYAYGITSELDDIDTNVTIVPSSSFTLTKGGGSSTVTAHVSQSKTTFTPSDIRNGTNGTIQISENGGAFVDTPVKKATAKGTISADVTSGTWTGTMTFTVS